MNDNINTMMVTSERMASLKSAINNTEESLLFAKADRDTAHAERYDARISIESFRSSHGQRDLSTQVQNELDALTTRHKEASEAFEQSDSLYQDLSSKLTTLNSELNELIGCDHGITLDDVITVQSDIKKAQDSADEIQTLINKHNKTIQDGVESRHTLNGLYQKRDDLRAELALGNASKSDLAALDKEIETEKKKADDVDAKAKEAQYTAQGLQRKLIPAIEKVNELQSISRAVVIQFLQGKMERLIAEYSLAAQPLIEAFKQVHELSQLMVNEFKHPPVTGPLHMQMCIPSFHLGDITGVVNQHSTALFSFRQGMDAGEFIGVEVDDIKQMRELGLLN